MAKKAPCPLIDVAVTLITRGQQILAVYNPDWGSFTLPMTKRREWHDPGVPNGTRHEEWIDAAARAAAEWLGRTSASGPSLLLEIAEFSQSDRDGVWKRYRFQIFQLAVKQSIQPLPQTITEWLTLEKFCDENRRPVSPTSRMLLKRLAAERLLHA